MTTSREDIVDGYIAFHAIHDCVKGGRDRFKRKGLYEISTIGTNALFCDETPYETLRRLEPGALEVYFALVDRFQGRAKANEAILSYARVGWPWGVTVHVENSDDDPFRVSFHVSDEIASDWADANGSLDGGTWETADGTDFVYDCGQWHEDLFENLRKEGYDLDLSSWNDPDEEDLALARHAHGCEECQEHWDFDKIREHVAKLNEPLVDVALGALEKALENGSPEMMHWEATPGGGCVTCESLFLRFEGP